MANDTQSLAGKVVVLLGATGALGGAVAARVRAAGGRLGLCVRKPWQVEPLVQQFGRDGVLAGVVGTGDTEAAAGFAKGVRDALGPIDALLCANGAFRAARVGTDPQPVLRELLDANLFAATTMVRAVVGAMQRRRSGSLVFVGSAQVGRGGAGMADYLASKAALHEYVRALAVELDGTGVRACALLPTVLDTAANRAAMPDADRSAWLPLDQVAARMLELAFAPSPPAGPLVPV